MFILQFFWIRWETFTPPPPPAFSSQLLEGVGVGVSVIQLIQIVALGKNIFSIGNQMT